MNKQTLYGDSYFVPTLLEGHKSGDKMILEGVFQRSDVENKNGRKYSRKIWEKALFENKDGYAAKAVQENSMLGHLEHPKDGVSDMNLSAIHITHLELQEDGTVFGRCEVMEDTPKGQIVAAHVRRGIRTGISSRGSGSVDSSGNVGEDFRLSTFDIVTNPSTPGANLVLAEGVEEETAEEVEIRERASKIGSKVYHAELRIAELLKEHEALATGTEKRKVREELLAEMRNLKLLGEAEESLYAPVTDHLASKINESVIATDDSVDDLEESKVVLSFNFEKPGDERGHKKDSKALGLKWKSTGENDEVGNEIVELSGSKRNLEKYIKQHFAPTNSEEYLDLIENEESLSDDSVDEAAFGSDEEIADMKAFLVKHLVDKMDTPESKAKSEVRQMSNQKVRREYDAMKKMEDAPEEGEVEEAMSREELSPLVRDAERESNKHSRVLRKKFGVVNNLRLDNVNDLVAGDQEVDLDELKLELKKLGYREKKMKWGSKMAQDFNKGLILTADIQVGRNGEFEKITPMPHFKKGVDESDDSDVDSLEEGMTLSQMVKKHGSAQGGNLVAMVGGALKEYAKKNSKAQEAYDSMPEDYDLMDVMKAAKKAGINVQESDVQEMEEAYTGDQSGGFKWEKDGSAYVSGRFRIEKEGRFFSVYFGKEDLGEAISLDLAKKRAEDAWEDADGKASRIKGLKTEGVNNQSEYTHYVVGTSRKGKVKILSAWEYPEDAEEGAEEAEESPKVSKVKVFTKVGLRKHKLDPNNDDDWANLHKFESIDDEDSEELEESFKSFKREVQKAVKHDPTLSVLKSLSKSFTVKGASSNDLESIAGQLDFWLSSAIPGSKEHEDLAHLINYVDQATDDVYKEDEEATDDVEETITDGEIEETLEALCSEEDEDTLDEEGCGHDDSEEEEDDDSEDEESVESVDESGFTRFKAKAKELKGKSKAEVKKAMQDMKKEDLGEEEDHHSDEKDDVLETEISSLRTLLAESHEASVKEKEAYMAMLSEAQDRIGELEENIEELEGNLNTAGEQIANLKAKETRTVMDRTVESLVAKSPVLSGFEGELKECSSPAVATNLAEKLLSKISSGKEVQKRKGDVQEEVSSDELSSPPQVTSSDLSESTTMPSSIQSEVNAGEPVKTKKVLSESVAKAVALSKIATHRKQN